MLLSLSLCRSLFTAACASFAFLGSRVFLVPGHSTPPNYVESSQVLQVTIHELYSFVFWFKNDFLKVKPS